MFRCGGYPARIAIWMRVSAVCAGLFALLPVCPANAVSGKVLLRNDLTPGSLATYTIRITSVRTSPLLRYTEKLTYEQDGKLTLLVLESPEKGQARRVWMMELGESRITGLVRDGVPIDDLPHPKMLGLPPKVAQLRTSIISSAYADASVVGGSAVQRGGLLVALDFVRWPEEMIEVGQTWQTQAERPELDGAWTHTFSEIIGKRSEKVAVGEFSFSGQLAGPLQQAGKLKTAEGTWRWRVAKRLLESASADIQLSYGLYERLRDLEMHVVLKLENSEHLPRGQMPTIAGELNTLGKLAGETAGLAGADTVNSLRKFIAENKDSLWMPVAKDLLDRAEFDSQNLGQMTEDRLVSALTSLVTRWQLASFGGQTEPLQPLRATFAKLIKTNRDTIHRLAGSEDANLRAIAVFCTAFGKQPADLQRVVACCADREPRVRAWAVYGLAERGQADVDPDLLAGLLADTDEMVRSRACMAVAACIRPDSTQRSRFFDLLLKVVQNDTADSVRPHAAVALDVLAEKRDLPELIHAESLQEVPPARRLLENTIKRLGGKTKSNSD